MKDPTRTPAGRKRAQVLPENLPPIGISREQAAAFIGVSSSTFDKAIGKSMPNPRELGGRLIWDVDELVQAFKKLPHRNGDDYSYLSEGKTTNPWDEEMGGTYDDA